MTCTTPQEAEAFGKIGRVVGRERVLLLDRCLVQGPFRVHSGARTMFVNLGIAAPRDRNTLIAVLTSVYAGALPDDDVLREIGVTSFLTTTNCAGVSRETIADRFGAPVAVVPLRDGAALGAPGARYEVYDLPPGGEDTASG